MNKLEKEIDRMKDVCRFEVERSQGHFLTYIFEAFISADKDNSFLMLPLMKELQKKYTLKKEQS